MSEGRKSLFPVHRLLVRLSTRRCRRIICRESIPHDGHLTLIGRWRYGR